MTVAVNSGAEMEFDPIRLVCARANSVTLVKVVLWLAAAFAWLTTSGVRTANDPSQASFPAGSHLLPLAALQIFPVE